MSWLNTNILFFELILIKKQPLLLLFTMIFGVYLVYLICLILIGLSPLLMTTLGCVGSISCKKNLKLFPFSNNFIRWSKLNSTQRLKSFVLDNGAEYFSDILGSYFKDNGTIHHSSCVNTPQQNGIAKRKNWHLLKVARTLMFQSNVPKTFFGKKPYSQPLSSSIVCPLESTIVLFLIFP